MPFTIYDFDHPASRLVVRLEWRQGWHVCVRDVAAMRDRTEWNRWAPGQHVEYTSIPLDEWLKQAERDFGLVTPAC